MLMNVILLGKEDFVPLFFLANINARGERIQFSYSFMSLIIENKI